MDDQIIGCIIKLLSKTDNSCVKTVMMTMVVSMETLMTSYVPSIAPFHASIKRYSMYQCWSYYHFIFSLY